MAATVNTLLTLKSPAKINLFLRVLGKRSDGYHELATLMQAVSLCDTLTIQLNDSCDKLSCTDSTIPTDDSNLVLKATSLFRNKTGLKSTFSINLEKVIPHQAGLGGGSSNAATTLWACNKLTNAQIPDSVLAEWAAEIGSDVAFFLSPGTAYCTGRGEILKPVKVNYSTNFTIIKPKEGLSTPKIFGKLQISSLQHRDPESILKGFCEGNYDYFNDLETAALDELPLLKDMKQQLHLNGFTSVTMSGSGSSFFCTGSGIIPNGLKYYNVFPIVRKPGNWYTEVK